MRVTDRIRSIDIAKPFPWRFLAPLLIGSALNPINSSVIATAMVPVATAMHSSVGRTTVLISALYVATAIGQSTAGKLAEQWLEAARGISASSAGLLLLPMAGLAAALALPVAARNLVRAPLIAAGVSCLVGSFGLLLVTTTTSVIWIVLVTTVFGITLATTTTANQTALYTEVSADQLGTASGLLRSFGYVGSIASAALISVVFHATVDDHGLHVIAWIMVGVSAIGLIALAADPAVVPNRIARKLLGRNGKGSGLPVPRTLDQAGQR
jgi:MFS family permease